MSVLRELLTPLEAEHPLDLSIAKQMAIEYFHTNRPKFWAEGNPYAEYQPEEEDSDEAEYNAHREPTDLNVDGVYKKVDEPLYLVHVDMRLEDPKDKEDGLDWGAWVMVDIDKDTVKEVTNTHKWIRQDFITGLYDGDDKEFSKDIAKRTGSWESIE